VLRITNQSVGFCEFTAGSCVADAPKNKLMRHSQIISMLRLVQNVFNVLRYILFTSASIKNA
jgi:hypothetical protein